MISGTDNFAFRQNSIHGSAPIAQLYSSTKACTFFGDCEIPNMYNKTSVGPLIGDIYDDILKQKLIHYFHIYIYIFKQLLY